MMSGSKTKSIASLLKQKKDSSEKKSRDILNESSGKKFDVTNSANKKIQSNSATSDSKKENITPTSAVFGGEDTLSKGLKAYKSTPIQFSDEEDEGDNPFSGPKNIFFNKKAAGAPPALRTGQKEAHPKDGTAKFGVFKQ